MKTKSRLALAALALLSTFSLQLSTAFAQGTAFTYQGWLNDNGSSANGSYDLTFSVWDAPSGSSQIGGAQIRSATAVSNGLFTVTLDFGAGVFTGPGRWLQIAVQKNGGPFTTLSPRQPIAPTPYAIYANGASASGISGAIPAAALSNAWQTSGNAGTVASQFIGTTDDQPLNIKVNNTRVMRYRLNTDSTGIYTNAPNVIGGSSENSVFANVVGATIAGGGGIEVSGLASVGNEVHADHGTVGGGVGNVSSGLNSTIAGGYKNTCSGPSATVAGGIRNVATDNGSTVGGGGGNRSSGFLATVPGGGDNEATADYSFAAGHRAKADNRGSFVWADANDADWHSDVTNQFSVRCSGGARFSSTVGGFGVRLFPGDSSWSAFSDRNAKKNFSPVNAETVLQKLAAVPVQSWNYKWESDTNTPHIGPMAQDFKAAFYPGRDDKSISTLEFDGVELAAIQGLNERMKEKDARIAALEKSVSELKEIVAKLAAKR